MSQEQLKAFMEKVKEDKELQKKMAALPKNDRKAAMARGITIAVEAGFEVDEGDVTRIAVGSGAGELDDAMLEQVAGGAVSQEGVDDPWGILRYTQGYT